MALAKEVYREFEDILGPENISEDLVVLDAYACFGFGARGAEPEDRFYLRPEAVVLPGSTAEVQKVVQLCGRRGLKVKASSTGFGAHNSVGQPGTLLLDMRRMNRVLEIDEKNMYAVFEPYVNFAQLQAEAFKRGLSCHVIGAGSNCSALASCTSMHGTNTQAVSHGWGGRNVLGVEWVLPTGELLRLGTPGSGLGWFCGDGPGPSLRGIMRGHAGAMGGLGVFTKCACHLHPWYGPSKFELQGVSPYYEAEIPEYFEYHVIEWPNWGKCADAMYKIGSSGIAFAIHKTSGPGSAGPLVTGNNNEYYEKWEELKELPWVTWAIVTAGASAEEHDWQVKTMNRIMEETGGTIWPKGEMDIWKKRDYINMVRSCFIPRLAFRPAGSFTCPLSGADSVDHMTFGLGFDDALRKKYDDQRLLLNDGNNGMWGVPFDNGHYALFECGHMYDPNEAASWKAGAQLQAEGMEIGLKAPFSGGWGLIGNDVVEKLGPLYGNQQVWQRKVKITFDPKTTSDPICYILPEKGSGGMAGFPSLEDVKKKQKNT